MQSQSSDFRFKTVLAVLGVIFLVVIVLVLIFFLSYLLFDETLDSRQGTNKNLPADLDYESVEDIYDYLRLNFDGQLDETKLLEGLKKGLLTATDDPYSVYLNPEEAGYFESDLFSQLVGVGIQLIIENNHPTVVTPLKDLPADQAGIKAKDTIIKIDGQPTGGMSLIEAVSLITGEEGTEVTLTIHRQGADNDLEFTMTRVLISMPTVEYEIKEGIGIMSINRFSPDIEEGEQTFELALQAAQTFKQTGVRGVILDLRSNPGGVLPVTLDIGGLWLEPGQVVTKVGPYNGELTIKVARGQDPPILSGIPLVVLVNEASASAAEIVAGALQDHGTGTIVGKTSFGKTSVQNVESLSEGSILKVTTSHWYTPNGTEAKEGIKPDIEVEDDFETETDEQLEKALQILQERV